MGSQTAKTVREAVLMALAATALVSGNKARAGAEPAPVNENTLEEIVVRGVALKYRPDDQTSATGLSLALIDTPQAIGNL